MSSKIKVLVSPSDIPASFEFTYEDLYTTEEEWMMISDGEKEAKVRQALDELPEQPYYYIDDIKVL